MNKIKACGKKIAKEWTKHGVPPKNSWPLAYQDWKNGHEMSILEPCDFEVLERTLRHKPSKKELDLFENAFWEEIYVLNVGNMNTKEKHHLSNSVVRQAQKYIAYKVEEEYWPRIKFGTETGHSWKCCQSCGAGHGELHMVKCQSEQCPRCEKSFDHSRCKDDSQHDNFKALVYEQAATPDETASMNELLKTIQAATTFGLSDLPWFPQTKKGMVARINALLLSLNIIKDNLEGHPRPPVKAALDQLLRENRQ